MLPLVAAVGIGFLDFDGEGFAAHLVPVNGAAGGSHVGGAFVVGSHQDGEERPAAQAEHSPGIGHDCH